jgi:hypothetical protein
LPLARCADYSGMNKHQFRTYCERVLIPQISQVINERLKEVADVLDIIARELIRVNEEQERARRRRGRARKS